MTLQTHDSPAIRAAIALLRQFTCVDMGLDQTTPDDPEQVRQALLLVTAHSDYQILGICADSALEATTALHDYLRVLEYKYPEIPATPAGAVYFKFNPKTGRCQVDSYSGQHRGVLVSCQSVYDGDVNETFGHLPLNLFRAP